MITDPFFYLCAIPAVLLFGMAKGGLGGGVAMISVPLMAMAVSPLQAAAIMLPILVVMDFVAVWSFRDQWNRTEISVIVPGALAGIVIGALTFRYLSEDAVRGLIGVIALSFSLEYFLRKAPPRQKQTNKVKGSFWGMVSGFTSFGIHSGGVPISVYLLPLAMEKKMLMGTFAVFFTIVNLVKLIPYAMLGQFSLQNLSTSLVLIPLAPIGVRLGYRLLEKINTIWIYKISYFSLLLIGARLFYEGLF